MSDRDASVRSLLLNLFEKDLESGNSDASNIKDSVLDFFEDEPTRQEVLFLLADLAFVKGGAVSVNDLIDECKKLGLDDHIENLIELLSD